MGTALKLAQDARSFSASG